MSQCTFLSSEVPCSCVVQLLFLNQVLHLAHKIMMLYKCDIRDLNNFAVLHFNQDNAKKEKSKSRKKLSQVCTFIGVQISKHLISSHLLRNR